jgi:Fe-S cluster assembly protein SufD
MSETAPAVRASVLARVLRDFRGIAADLPGDEFAHAARARAAARLTELGWPSTRDEHWRYANLRAFERLGSFGPSPAAALPAPLALPPAVPGFERLTFIDGRRVGAAHPLLVASAPPLATAPSWPAEQRLGLLGDMFASDTARLHIRGAAAIEILFISNPASTASYPRLELRLEPDSQLQLIERHLALAPTSAASAPASPALSLTACNVTVELGRGATLTHYRLQQCHRDCVFSDSVAARLEQQSRYAVRSIAIGGGSARTSASVQLAGRGAALAWAGIAVGRGEQVHDIALTVQHAAPDTRTEELFRGIADERARVAFSGHIQIDATAPASQARQSLRGLIESNGEIDLRPRLEILTDDVRAAHGATTGRLDEDVLFYLLARGIDRPTARALLKWAFLGDVLREIEVPALRAEAERLAAGQLPDVPPLGALP